MKNSEDPNFYLDLIEGKCISSLDIFSDEPEALRESMALNHAFDMLEELGDPSICYKLVAHIDSEIDVYSYQKSGAISVLGSLGEESHEKYVEQYLDSSNRELAFVSLCSICQLLERQKLTEPAADRATSRLVRNLTELNCSVEELVECARTLTIIKYEGLGELLEGAKSKYSEFWDNYRSSLN